MKTASKPRQRLLGRTGVKISEIGFGCWGIGKSMWGRTEDAESRQALRAALDLGIDYFDTAYAYGHGHSERLLSEALRSAGKEAFVATKVPPKNMQWPAHPRTLLGHSFPPEWIRSCTETSLRNLRMDCVDLQQFHVWHDNWLKDKSWPDTLAAVAKLKEEGKIRFFGVSVNSDDPDTALEVIRTGAVDTVQVILNLFDQRILEGFLPLCLEKKVGVVVRCVFDEGGLTGKLTPQTRFEPEDFRSHYFGGSRLEETCRRAQALERLLVPAHARSLADGALKYALSFPEVSTVIPGMRKAAHVEANARAADGRLFDKKLLETLKAHAWVRNYYE